MSTSRSLPECILGDGERVARAIDDFEAALRQREAGGISEAAFLELRLRHGVYGQRQDGVHMMRSKLPLGRVSARALEAFADVAERYGGGVAHLTTRQDIQVHFVDLEETPEVMRVLARAAVTSREACGNVVRNVTVSARSGVIPGEVFDVTPHGMGIARGLLLHPAGQDLGRKFKIHLSSVDDPRIDLSSIHDLGLTATRDAGGAPGFVVRVGGGLGPIPHEAKILYPFVPEDEALPLAVALLRVFARLGERRLRSKARFKFVVARLGVEALRREVERERAEVQGPGPWLEAERAALEAERPLAPAAPLPEPASEVQARFFDTSVFEEAEAGRYSVRVRVPRGDLDPAQLRGLARLVREETGETLRIDLDHSLVLRRVSGARVPTVHARLRALRLGWPGAGGLADPVTCPGADTCKLGVTRPRALAREAFSRLEALSRDPRLAGLTVKVSGCPNACAQHHVADIGLVGAVRSAGDRAAPAYLILCGGRPGGRSQEGDPSPFAQVVAKVPARHAPEAVARLAECYREEARPDESFATLVRRLGRARLRARIADLCDLPAYEEAPEMYREYGEAQPFEIRRGTGECAGELIAPFELPLAEAERLAERASDLLAEAAPAPAVAGVAIEAMRRAAEALLISEGEAPGAWAGNLSERFVERVLRPGRIPEGPAHTFLDAIAAKVVPEGEALHRLILESTLFVEEAQTHLAKVRARQRARGAA